MNTQPKATNPILKLHPKQSEAKKVSVDDGFIAIPRLLMLKIAKFGFTKHQRAVIDAVIIKCLGFHKDSDWISNPQIVELTDIGYGNKASTAKQELIRMNVLVQKGNCIGFNLCLDEWVKGDLPKQSNIDRNGKNKFTETVKGDLPKQSNTKETITKEKINNESTNVDSVQQPENPLPKKTKSEPVDYQGVMAEFNRAVENTPIPQIRAMSDERKRSVHTLAKILRKEFGGYTPKHFADYFQDFVQQASNRKDRFYFGGLDGSGWVANFGYIIRSKTFYNTWEDSL
ncbi:replication protein [Mannheimia varigena]|uniref:replication protein n=1 Tax=Mannheimia varigena TaxID=85404 RepID=UPI0015B5D302|nr:replication protein [Mannheimia varigena]QLD33191.1 replication protein [Mannheimia varigena]